MNLYWTFCYTLKKISTSDKNDLKQTLLRSLFSACGWSRLLQYDVVTFLPQSLKEMPHDPQIGVEDVRCGAWSLL